MLSSRLMLADNARALFLPGVFFIAFTFARSARINYSSAMRQFHPANSIRSQNVWRPRTVLFFLMAKFAAAAGTRDEHFIQTASIFGRGKIDGSPRKAPALFVSALVIKSIHYIF